MKLKLNQSSTTMKDCLKGSLFYYIQINISTIRKNT